MLKWLVTGIAITPFFGWTRSINYPEIPAPVLEKWNNCKKQYAMGIPNNPQIVESYFKPVRISSWKMHSTGYSLTYTNRFGHQLSFDQSENSFVHRILIQ